MSTIKKIAILFLTITLSLGLLITGAFAWFSGDFGSNSGGDDKRDVTVSSSYLFSSTLGVSLNKPGIDSEIINYASPEFDDLGTKMIYFNQTLLNEYKDANNEIDLDLEFKFNTFKDLNFRFKIIEQWKNGNTVIHNPNLIEIIYEDNLVKEQRNGSLSTYLYPKYTSGDDTSEDIIFEKKDSTADTLPIVKKLKVNGSIPSNYSYGIALVVSAIQNNRSYLWNENLINEVYEETLVLTEAVNLKDVKLVFDNLTTNSPIIHTLGVELFNETTNKSFSYIFHNRSKNNDLTLEVGEYKIKAFSINQLNIDFKFTGSKLTSINFSNNEDYTNWGYEDFLFSPNPIRVWNNSTIYSDGEIVEHLGKYYMSKASKNQWQPPDSSLSYWKELTLIYRGGSYNKGDVIFYNGEFWIATGYTGAPPSTYTPWKRIGKQFKAGNHSVGDIAYRYNTAGVKEWFYASYPGYLDGIAAYSGWKSMDHYNEFDNNIIKAGINEVVHYEGNYYYKNDDKDTPTGQWSNYTTGVNRGTHTFNNIYKRGDIVNQLVNGEQKSFMYINGLVSNMSTPSPQDEYNKELVSYYWYELTPGWSIINRNKNNAKSMSFVKHNNKLYYWKGSSFETNYLASNSVTPPGTARNGWQEATDDWSPFNDYKKGDFVYYDGALWSLLDQAPIDDLGNSIMPGGEGSINYWFNYKINWSPGRD